MRMRLTIPATAATLYPCNNNPFQLLIQNMRRIACLTVFTLLFGGFFNAAAANEVAVSEDVQKAINRITELRGQHTLTPEHTVRTITFADGRDLDPDAFDLFAEQSDLETLSIANYRELSDADVAKLVGLEKLRTLALTNGSITDAAVRTIAEAFPELISLNLASNSRLTDAAAREIAKLRELQVLNLLFCDFSEFGMVHISRLPKLRVLDIRGNMKIGNGGLRTLANLPALRNLQHRSPAVTDEGIRSLAAAKTMTDLLIQDFSITGQSGLYIRQMEALTNLQIFRCENFDSSGVLALGGLKLNRLTLRGLPVDDSAMAVFAELTTLRRLFLNELHSVSDAGLANLVHLQDLEILDIWESPITDRTLEVIASLPALKTLMLRTTEVTDEGLELLLTMPSLEEVTLRDNVHVTPEMIQQLRDAEKFSVRN